MTFDDSLPADQPNLTAASFGDRLRALRTELFGRRGQKRFAQFVSIPQSSLGKYEKGVSPNVDALRKIVEATAVNSNWLLCGVGEMFSDPAASESIETNIPIDALQIEYFGKVSGDRFLRDNVVPRTISGPVPAQCCNPRFFSLTIEGDTMEPELLDGDLLVFYRLPDPPRRDGKLDTVAWFERLRSIHTSIVCVYHRGVGMVRRLMLDPQQRLITLVSHSQRVLPIVAHPEDVPGAGIPASELQITGVLRTIVRSLADLTGSASSDELDTIDPNISRD